MANNCVPLPRNLVWCYHGLIEFYEDYPEPEVCLPQNTLVNGLMQMQAQFNSRNWRRDCAIADIKTQRILYDEEQRFVKYAMALLLKPHEYFQNSMFTRDQYLNACIIKILVEQSIYNYSPFLYESGKVCNEIWLRFHQRGFVQELLTRMVTESIRHTKKPKEPKEEPNSYPEENQTYMTMYGGLPCYGNWFDPWGPQPIKDEPSSVERAMDMDQKEVQKKYLRRRCGTRENRMMYASFAHGPVACDEIGRPLPYYQPATGIDAGESVPEVPPYQDCTYTVFQQLHRITVQKTYQANVWMKL